MREPMLTKRLKAYVQNEVARRHGLLGMWAAEDVIGDWNAAGKFEERRLDIVYGWNDESRSLELVFEFKRLRRRKRDRDEYLGERGLGRFVTGLYGRGQPVAAMVGVLLAPESEIVPPLKAALVETSKAEALRLRPSATGLLYTEPSTLFSRAAFDTEHDREAKLAPIHGYVRVAHFFVGFTEDLADA